jgi:glycosyltransferase involved in cell wall biosynthesis
VRETMRRELGEREIGIVPIGVDGAAFPAGPPLGQREERVLFVGFINYNKGVDVLLHAMASLRDRGVSASLTLVGASFYRKTRKQEEQLRQLARELRLDEEVSFVGRQAPEEVARLMRGSSVVVLPSRAESFGAVLVEALASGTPVVATRCGGPEDIVRPEVGALVPPDDPEALASAIARTLAERERFDVDALRRYALDRFEWSLVATQIRDWYDVALAKAESRQ